MDQRGAAGTSLEDVKAAADVSMAAGEEAHRAQATALSKSREPTSAMAVNEPGLGSSADGKGEEGIDRSFERTATPLHLGE